MVGRISRRIRSLRKAGRKIRRVSKRGGKRMRKRIKRRSVRRTRSLRKSSRRISLRGGKRKTKRSLRGGVVCNSIIEETQYGGKDEVWKTKQMGQKGHFYIRKKQDGKYRLDIIGKLYDGGQLGSNILTYNVNLFRQNSNLKAIVIDKDGQNPFKTITGIASNEVEALQNLVNNLNGQITNESFTKNGASYKGIYLMCNLDDGSALYRPIYALA